MATKKDAPSLEQTFSYEALTGIWQALDHIGKTKEVFPWKIQAAASHNRRRIKDFVEVQGEALSALTEECAKVAEDGSPKVDPRTGAIDFKGASSRTRFKEGKKDVMDAPFTFVAYYVEQSVLDDWAESENAEKAGGWWLDHIYWMFDTERYKAAKDKK